VSTRRKAKGIVILVGVAILTPAALGLVAALADRAAIVRAGGHAIGDPVGVGLIGAALIGAFSARAVAWRLLLPALGLGQALAAIHVALGANHVLPLRLGEPLRVVSAVRRTDVGLGPATSTAVVLRAGDVVALLVLGLVAGPHLIASLLGWWGLLAAAGVTAIGAVALALLGRSVVAGGLRGARPGWATVALTVGAWLLEAVVVWRVAGWFDVQLSASEAVMVLAAAVGAQLVAVTPAGVGTYEAAAAVALTATGVPFATALAVAVTVHGVKTVYSLVAGAVGVFHPAPGLVGRWRLPGDAPPVATDPAGPARPVVLFLPANDEGPRVADVVAAAPSDIDGHPVEVVVVDDGSTDDTADRARAAGATVVAHPTRRGLGAAVRTGLAVGVERGAAAVAFCDADGEYDPAELPALVRPILAGRAHYVVGTRFGGRIDRMHPHRRLGNRLLTRWLGHVVGRPVTDGQSGYRALSPVAAAGADIAHEYNYAQVLTVDLVAKGFGYHEVPISYHFRRSGRSFIRPGAYLGAVVPTVWRQLNPAGAARSHPSDEPLESPSCPPSSAVVPLSQP
jgi:uncharacterized membrane protein YbhN (UPF0104 family)